MATTLDTGSHFPLTLWDIWGPVVGGGETHTNVTPRGPFSSPSPGWLSKLIWAGGSWVEFVGGWIGASPASSQFEWEGDNLFF